jgi:hypothetical protein
MWEGGGLDSERSEGGKLGATPEDTMSKRALSTAGLALAALMLSVPVARGETPAASKPTSKLGAKLASKPTSKLGAKGRAKPGPAVGATPAEAGSVRAELEASDRGGAMALPSLGVGVRAVPLAPDVELVAGPAGPSLARGHILVATASAALTITVGGGRVRLAPYSLVELERGPSGLRTVAVVAGRARVEGLGPTRGLGLADVWTPAGRASLGPSRAAWLAARREPRPLSRATAAETALAPELALEAGSGESWARVEVEPEDSIRAEAERLEARALELWHGEGSAERAALAFDDLLAYLGDRAPSLTAVAGLVEVLFALDRRLEALERLDETELDASPLGRRLRAERGVLRGETRRCDAALPDLDAALASRLPAADEGRARFRRGLCRLRLGDRAAAWEDLELVAAQAPDPALRDAARRQLRGAREPG